MKEQKNKHSKEIKEELKDLSPFLLKMKEKDLPFKAPNQYFEQLQHSVFQKISTEELPSQTGKSPNTIFSNLLDQITALLQPQPRLALATVLILAIGGWFIFSKAGSTTQPMEVNLADLSTNEINDYIESNMIEFEDQDIIQSMANTENISIIPQEEVSQVELDQYLYEVIEEIDPQDLEELF